MDIDVFIAWLSNSLLTTKMDHNTLPIKRVQFNLNFVKGTTTEMIISNGRKIISVPVGAAVTNFVLLMLMYIHIAAGTHDRH